ncbi:MAG: hypothetical protein COA84_11605, partial [Robiginitomaculum sp.]
MGFYSAFGAVYEAKLGHGRPLAFLRSRDDLAATTPKPINNNEANRGTNPAAGIGCGECRSLRNGQATCSV